MDTRGGQQAADLGAPNRRRRSSRRWRLIGALTAVGALAAGTLTGAGVAGAVPAPTPKIDAWTGIVDPVNPSAPFGDLSGVSCVSASFCVAVGSEHADGLLPKTSVRQWNGIDWTVVPSPTPSGLSGELFSVSCTSTTFCMAVGDVSAPATVSTPATTQTLTEQWNGTAWAVVTSPNTSPTVENSLSAVSCVSPTSCMAVGTAGTNALTAHWHGSAWQDVTGTGWPANSTLYSVSCAADTMCFAVGWSASADGSIIDTLLERWTGSGWGRTPVNPADDPNLGNFSNPGSVSCPTTTWCTTASGAIWNGSTWSASTTLNSVVSCTSPGACVAIDGGFVESWDGSQWTGEGFIGLDYTSDLSCISASMCVTVGGFYDEADNSPTYIEMTSNAHVQVPGTPSCRTNSDSYLWQYTDGLPPTQGAYQIADAKNQETFVAGADGSVYHNYLTGATKSDPGFPAGWSTLGTPPGGIFGSVRNGTNYVKNQELYVRSNNGQVYHLFATPGKGSGWSNWDPLGGPAAGIAGDVYEGTNYLKNQELYVLGTDGNVYHKFSTPGQGTGWSGWDTMDHPAGTTLVGDVQVGANYLCNQEIYVTDSTGLTWHKFSTPGQGTGWSDWGPMGVPAPGAKGAVAAGENSQNNQELFIVGNDNQVYHDYSTPGKGSGWSGWSPLSAPPGTITSTAVTVDTYPVQKLTVTTTTGTYVDRSTPGVGSGWSGWTQVWG